MALLFIEGFEGYANAQDMLSVGSSNTAKVIACQSNVSISSTTYRTTQVTAANSRSLALPNGTNDNFAAQFPGRTEIIVGFGFQPTTNGANGTFLVIGTPNYSGGIVLAFDVSTGVITAHTTTNGAPGTLLGTASGTYSVNVWHYIEIRVKLGTTTGEIQLQINGTEVLNLTNVNTASGSLSSYTGLGSNPYFAHYIDDLYICDTTGASNNTFLGPISVYTLMPTGAGSATDLDPVGAASNWQSVNEATANTTTYVETNVTGEKDYYTYQSLPAGVATVFGVQARARSTTPDNGGRRLRINFKNAVNVISSALRILPMASWVYDYYLSETAPDGSAWTKTSVDSTEVGVEAQ